MEGLTDQELKQLTIDIAIKIAPEIIKRTKNSDDASENVAIFSRDIADAVNSVLIDKTGNGL